MIAITGANGRLGRAIAQRMATQGLSDQVTLVTRDAAKVSDLADLGFQVETADYSDPESVTRALRGVNTCLLISATGPAEARIPLHRNAIDAAARAGIERVVYTSRVNPSAESPYPFARIHDDSEARLRESSMRWTFLRNNEYSENLGPWIQEAVATRVLRFGAAGKIAFVSRDDVVNCTITALLGDEYANRLFEISGPEAVDRDDIARIISETTGIAVHALTGDSDEYADVLASQDRPDFIVDMGRGLYEASLLGEWATPSHDVEQLLGRKARSVSDYVREVARSAQE